MEASMEESGVIIQDGEKSFDQEVEEADTPPLLGSTMDDDTDEDSEPETLGFIRRKVSFADAFGLNLVSVKEFDNVEVAEAEVSQPPKAEAALPLEFTMYCLFTAPSSQEELDERLQGQMIELESIEFLPGTPTLRGIIRVVNLCYNKSVFARISLDRWNSYFDLLAEYIPGSSDRKTDRFTFKYTLVPPFAKEGTRVDFCLRYETPAATFWANNRDMNYVLVCYQKAQLAKEHGHPALEESNSYKSKRSCLRANRRGSAEEKTMESVNTAVWAEAHKDEEADTKPMDNSEILSTQSRKPLVDSIKSWRLTRVQDHVTHVPTAYSHDSATGQEVSQPLPTPWCQSASIPRSQQKKPNDNPQVLTYHQIPLLTLDNIWNGNAQLVESKASEENPDEAPSVSDLWEHFLNGTDDTNDKEAPVCDIWQTFLNEPCSKDHSGVPESEWLQTATSVSPSNPKEPQMSTQDSLAFPNFRVGIDTPAALHACQPPSDKCKASSSYVDHLPAGARVSGPMDDIAGAEEAPQRSKTKSVTDTLQGLSLEGATPVTTGAVGDGSVECHKHAAEGIIGAAEGIGGDEPVTAHTADLVTSSGESETTDMTAMPESQNASAVDIISQGARLGEGLSSSGGEEVTGTAHNTMDDTLAFRETIRQGTESGEGFVFSTSRQRAEGEIMTKCMENKVPTDEEIFSSHKAEGRDSTVSQRQREEFILKQKDENPSQENETRPEQSHADTFNPKQTCEENIRLSLSELEWDESEIADMASGYKDLQGFRRGQVENSYCTKTTDTKRPISADSGTILFEEEKQTGNTSIISEVQDKHSRPVQAEEDLCDQEEAEDTSLTQTEENGLERRAHDKFSGIEVCQNDCNISSPLPADKCNPIGLDMIEFKLDSSQDAVKGQVESAGSEVSPEDVMAEAELQRQPEKVRTIKEERLSILDKTIEAGREMMGDVEDKKKSKAQDLFACLENVPLVECTTENAIEMETVEDHEMAEMRANERFRERFGEELVSRILREVFAWSVQNFKSDFNSLEGSRERLAPFVSSRAKDIMEETAVKPEVSRLDEMLIERFGEELVRRIWEEVFGCKVQVDRPGSAHKANLLCDNYDVKDQILSLGECLEQSTVTGSKEYPSGETSPLLVMVNQAQVLPALQSNLNDQSQDLPATLSPLSQQSLAESAQSAGSPKALESSQIQERSVAGEDSPAQPLHKHTSCLAGNSQETRGLLRWSIFMLIQITKLMVCILLVAGFFVVLSLYDFPTFCAAYLFSLCCWGYKWKRHQEAINKGTGREFIGDCDVKECADYPLDSNIVKRSERPSIAADVHSVHRGQSAETALPSLKDPLCNIHEYPGHLLVKLQNCSSLTHWRHDPPSPRNDKPNEENV